MAKAGEDDATVSGPLLSLFLCSSLPFRPLLLFCAATLPGPANPAPYRGLQFPSHPRCWVEWERDARDSRLQGWKDGRMEANFGGLSRELGRRGDQAPARGSWW